MTNSTAPLQLAGLDPTRAPGLPGWSRLDAGQRAAVLAPGAVRRVVGAPGTGKTTVALHRVLHAVRVEGLAPQECLLIASSRAQATRLRERLTAELAATTSHVSVRTLESLAFSLVRAADADQQATPQLITGAEQDVVLGELMAGHAVGHGRPVRWPASLTEAVGTRGLRSELRELLMRLAELGAGADELRELAARRGEPAWAAAADVLGEYEEVIALSRPGACDAAGLLAQASAVVGDPSDPSARDLVGSLSLIVVDDAQELTPAGVSLLQRLAEVGVRLLLVGDPDVATQTFRGAAPHLLARPWRGEPEAVVPVDDTPEDAGEGVVVAGGAVVLRTCHRAGRALVDAADRVAAHIGTAGVAAHRGPAPDAGSRAVSSGSPVPADEGRVDVAVTASAAHEARHIAMLLRRAHLQHGIAWDDMAVIVRTGSAAASLRRALSAESVPVTVPGARVPLRDEPAVRPLLAILELALSQRPHVRATAVTDLLTSRVIGADSLTVRALRRDLRRAELAAGGTRSSDELLVAALDPTAADAAGDRAVPLPAPLRRLVRAIDAGRRAARLTGAAADATGAGVPPDALADALADASSDSASKTGASAAGAVDGAAVGAAAASAAMGSTARVGVDEVLWAIWSSLGLADTWRAAAVRGGSAGARADRDLDAVCALFDAAGRYVERLPGSRPRGFLEHVIAQEIAADSLVARRAKTGEVTLTTPAGAVGGQWHTVVVAGVQEGVWPDLRPRGSTLRVPELLDALTAGSENSRDVSVTDHADRIRRQRHDEARLLLVAVSRARAHLVLTAVRDEENQPSAYLDVVDPARALGVGEDDQRLVPATRPLSIPGVVADLRRALSTTSDPRVRAALARRLARFADAGVAAADPQRWWAGHGATDERPVWPPDARVPVSPSRVEAFTRCGLRWLLTACGGQSAHESTGIAIGNLVHEIAAEVDNGDETALQAALAQRWPRLGMGNGWLAQRQYELAAAMLTRLARYDAQASADGWHVVGRELAARVDVGRARVTGRVDRLEMDSRGRLRVVDLKTGAGKPARAELARLPQLGAYQVAVERGAFGELGDGSAGAALLQLGKAAGAQASLQVQPALDRDSEPLWAETLVRDVAEGMGARSFEARTGEACRTCPALDSCPLQAARWTL